MEGHCIVPKRLKVDGFNLGQWLQFQRTRRDKLSPERRQRLDDIGFVWDPIAEFWEEGFSKLLQFRETEGHCRVVIKHKQDGFNLGAWVSNQRTKQDSMSSERRQKLDDIGFVWDPFSEDWEVGFSKLLQFQEAEGHCMVPDGFKLDGFNLGVWLTRQRKRKDSMSPERKQRLDDLGFNWDPKAEFWEEGFSKLLQFRETEGHCRVVIKHKQDGFNLGAWVSNQRTKQDSMSSERRQKLDDIGFVWDPFSEDWEEGFSKLLQFQEAEGHSRVHAGFKLDGFNLRQWVSRQRNKQDSMSSERRQRLDDIGFVWDPVREAWEEGFSKLVRFKETEGHLRVTQRFKLNGFSLGQWVSSQRAIRDNMSSERRQRLDDIGFIWDASTDET